MQLSLIGVVAFFELATIVCAKGPIKYWNCENTPQSCNNACFAVACQGFSWELQYEKDKSKQEANRRSSGADPQPCEDLNKYKGVKRQDSDFVTADEYPFASARKGGKDAILRCTTRGDSNNQMDQVSHLWDGIEDGGWIDIRLENVKIKDSPYCAGFVDNPKVKAKSVCDNHKGFEFVLDVSGTGGKASTYKACKDYKGNSRRDLGGLVGRAAALAAGLESEKHSPAPQ